MRPHQTLVDAGIGTLHVDEEAQLRRGRGATIGVLFWSPAMPDRHIRCTPHTDWVLHIVGVGWVNGLHPELLPSAWS